MSYQKKDKIFPVSIIGCGPAGISAAIQLRRADIDLLIFEKDRCGGLLKNANLIENYPGFNKGISGLKLTNYFKKHLVNLNIIPIIDEVIDIYFSDDKKIFNIKTKNSFTYKSKICIIAIGLSPIKPEYYKNLSNNIKKKIYFEIFPIITTKKKKLLIIGAGDAAFDYALNLSKNNKITIINRGINIKALKLLQSRVMKNKNIEYFDNTEIKDIINNKNFLSVNFNNKQMSDFDYIIYAIGRERKTKFLSSQILKKSVELQDKKLLYFIGDINNEKIGQSTIAIGEGIKTAMIIQDVLDNI